MTQEEKSLLLKDLCARLPYGVIISVKDIDNFQFDGILRVIGKNWCRLNILDPIKKAKVKNPTIPLNHIYIKPYLRPMSSMTEEEQKEFIEFHCVTLCPIIDTCLTIENENNMFIWLNAHHFDYRGLIPMRLALEAPEDMYNTKTE